LLSSLALVPERRSTTWQRFGVPPLQAAAAQLKKKGSVFATQNWTRNYEKPVDEKAQEGWRTRKLPLDRNAIPHSAFKPDFCFLLSAFVLALVREGRPTIAHDFNRGFPHSNPTSPVRDGRRSA